jgi:hypothetical protein
MTNVSLASLRAAVSMSVVSYPTNVLLVNKNPACATSLTNTVIVYTGLVPTPTPTITPTLTPTITPTITPTPSTTDTNYLLQEDGFYLLQEDGSKIIIT